MVMIYTLCDPTTGQVRYVGKTKSPLQKRLNQHCCKQNLSKDSHTTHWIKKLQKSGLKPRIELLDTVQDSFWEETEKYWIEQCLQWGFNLTNTSPGGESGCLGYKHTESAKARISKLNSRPKSEEWKANAAAGMRAVREVPILQCDVKGNLINRWQSVHFAATALGDATGSKKKNITACCRGKRPTAYGYTWKYEIVGAG